MADADETATTADAAASSPIANHDDADDALTIDQLELALQRNDYTADELQQAIDYERSHQSRKGALTALEEEFDAVTSGPEEESGGTEQTAAQEPSTMAEDTDSEGGAPPDTVTAMDVSVDSANENGHVESRRASDGGGATGGGSVGVVLPAPEHDAAPDTVAVLVPTEQCAGGSTETYPVGTYDMEYDRRLKGQLETETNRLQLSKSDPLHPEHDEWTAGDEEL